MLTGPGICACPIARRKAFVAAFPARLHRQPAAIHRHREKLPRASDNTAPIAYHSRGEGARDPWKSSTPDADRGQARAKQ